MIDRHIWILFLPSQKEHGHTIQRNNKPPASVALRSHAAHACCGHDK
jgi:hypothetical protein